MSPFPTQGVDSYPSDFERSGSFSFRSTPSHSRPLQRWSASILFWASLVSLFHVGLHERRSVFPPFLPSQNAWQAAETSIFAPPMKFRAVFFFFNAFEVFKSFRFASPVTSLSSSRPA